MTHLVPLTYASLRRCLAGGLLFVLVALARGEPAAFDISAQPAGDALLAFSKQAGAEVLFEAGTVSRESAPTR